MKYQQHKKALVLLADGTIFYGKSIGIEGTASGDTITVPSDVYQVPLGLDPNDPDKLYDVTMSATAIYISADSIIGALNLVALSIPATCNFKAGKN